jgi:hypothetical protein
LSTALAGNFHQGEQGLQWPEKSTSIKYQHYLLIPVYALLPVDLLVSVAALMAEDPFKLLIVDSIMANFRNDFQGCCF